MVPFTQPLLLACRKLAAKLMASMRFEGRIFISEVGWPEHEYDHLLQLFGESSSQCNVAFNAAYQGISAPPLLSIDALLVRSNQWSTHQTGLCHHSMFSMPST